MKILVLNGSPRPQGNTAAMVTAFAEGAQENGHSVDIVNVCQKKIAGCLACEYCHQKGSGHERQCVQQDDMLEGLANATLVMTGGYKTLDRAEILEIFRESL